MKVIAKEKSLEHWFEREFCGRPLSEDKRGVLINKVRTLQWELDKMEEELARDTRLIHQLHAARCAMKALKDGGI